MKSGRRVWLAAGLALLLAGAIPLGWVQGKAWLAQVLIARSWSAAQAGDARARPWPWADFRPVAVLEIPRLQRTLYVLDGLSLRTLAFGPGYWQDRETGDTVLAGHRDSHFIGLKKLRLGDRIRLDRGRGPEEWRVVEVLDLQQPRLNLPGDGSLFLSTCLPDHKPGPTPYRRVVRAVREHTPAHHALVQGEEPGRWF